MTSSLALIGKLQRRNLLSKEAAAKVLAQREELLNRAIEKQAGVTFDAIRRAAGAVKDAPGNFLAKFRQGGRTDPSGGWSDVTSNLGKMLALAGLTTAATTGTSALVNKIHESKLNKRIEKSYSSLLKDEDIQEREKVNPGHTAAAFGILSRFAPSLAAEPLVAKPFIVAGGGSITSDGVEHGQIDSLVRTQKMIDERRVGQPAFRPIDPVAVATQTFKGDG